MSWIQYRAVDTRNVGETRWPPHTPTLPWACPCTCPAIRKSYWCLKYSWPISVQGRSTPYFPLNMFSFQPSYMQMTAHLIDAVEGEKERRRGVVKKKEHSLICSFNCWTFEWAAGSPKRFGVVWWCKFNAAIVLKVWGIWEIQRPTKPPVLGFSKGHVHVTPCSKCSFWQIFILNKGQTLPVCAHGC